MASDRTGAMSYERIKPRMGASSGVRGVEITLYLPSSYLVIWLVLLILSLPLIGYALHSGAVRWILSLLIITTVAVVALAVMHPRKGPARMEMMPLAVREKQPFEELKEMVSRSLRGYRYSQVMLSERVGDAFLDKVRIARGISVPDALSSAMDEERFFSLCGDRDLARFVVRSRTAAGSSVPRFRMGRRSREGQRYMRELMRILDRVESWR